MIDWLHSLSSASLVVVVCITTALITTAIYLIVTRVAGENLRGSLASVSPGLLPPMSLVFGLLIGFLAAEVWSNSSDAEQAVHQEAGALRSVDLLDRDFPAAEQQRMDALINRYIDRAVQEEWPAMAEQSATLQAAPPELAAALQLALQLPADDPGQVVAQREIVAALNDALEARRERIIISESGVNSAKWAGVIGLGVLTLIAIGCVHCANRRTAAVAMALFASAICVSLLMIGVQDRPFAGPYKVEPTPLIQVQPRPPV